MPTITCRTKIEYGGSSEAVGHAVKSLLRDIKAVCLPSGSAGLTIVLKSDDTIAGESYRIGVRKDSLVVRAGDELGFIYGLYAVSRSVLGVHDLWFWNDQTFAKKESWPVGDGFELRSKPYAVRYRGWFINDEVLLHAWRVDGSKDKPWEMAFEALLRLGGNMVIPGTHSNAHRYNKLASGMGLYITHHHAEPLGAPMFWRRHPDLTPSYDQHPGLFEALWREGIESQKGMKVVWNLGFWARATVRFGRMIRAAVRRRRAER